MLAYCSNSNAVYRVQYPVDTSHSYVSFLSIKAYYNSFNISGNMSRLNFTQSSRRGEIASIHILHVYVTLYRHTLPQYFTISSRV